MLILEHHVKRFMGYVKKKKVWDKEVCVSTCCCLNSWLIEKQREGCYWHSSSCLRTFAPELWWSLQQHCPPNHRFHLSIDSFKDKEWTKDNWSSSLVWLRTAIFRKRRLIPELIFALSMRLVVDCFGILKGGWGRRGYGKGPLVDRPTTIFGIFIWKLLRGSHGVATAVAGIEPGNPGVDVSSDGRGKSTTTSGPFL